MRTMLVFIFVSLALSQQAFAAGSALLRSGNSAYDNKKYGIAFDLYQEAAQKGSMAYGQYNSGAALYRLKDYGNAAKAYLNAAEQDPALKQNAYFNAGNSFYNVDKEKAAALYRQAYLMNLKDEEALHNLQLTIQEKNQQQQQQQNNQNKDNKQNNQDKQDKQNNKNDKQQEKQDNTQKDNNISKEEADSVLQMLKEQGNNVLAPAAQPKQETVDKDW